MPAKRLAERRAWAFDAVEVARHRFLPGEVSMPPVGGHVLTLHVGDPVRQRTVLDGGKGWEGTIPPGNIEVFPAGRQVGHELGAVSGDVNVLLGEDFFARVAEEAGADPDRLQVVERFDARDPELECLLLSLVSEAEGGGLGGELYAQALATAAAVRLLRGHSSLGESEKRGISREPAARKLPDRALRRALDHIHDNLAGDLSLQEIAASANVSPHHFSRLFKASTGLPPHQYVIRERVGRARDLLLKGDLDVAAAAREAGFYDQAHLTRHTRRLLGVTPGRIARESKNVQKGSNNFQ